MPVQKSFIGASLSEPTLARNLYNKACTKSNRRKNVFQKNTTSCNIRLTAINRKLSFQKCVGLTKLPFCHQPCHRKLQQRLLILQIWYSQPYQGGFIKAFVPHMERIYSRYWSLHCHMKMERANRGRLTQWGGNSTEHKEKKQKWNGNLGWHGGENMIGVDILQWLLTMPITAHMTVCCNAKHITD